MGTRRIKSWLLGRGGWSLAKYSVRCPPRHSLDGSVPDEAQITVWTMPGGIENGVGALLVTYGTANCMNADQIGAAPVRPVVLTIGV
jgi:hypothetical protein